MWNFSATLNKSFDIGCRLLRVLFTQFDRRPSLVSHIERPPCKKGKGKGSPYSITERRVPELIPVLGSQPAGDVSHKPGGRLPLLSARPAITPVTLKRAVTNLAAW